MTSTYSVSYIICYFQSTCLGSSKNKQTTPKTDKVLPEFAILTYHTSPFLLTIFESFPAGLFIIWSSFVAMCKIPGAVSYVQETNKAPKTCQSKFLCLTTM